MALWNILIFGLKKPQEKISLGFGLHIVPIEKNFNTYDFLAARAAGFIEAGIIEPLSHGCECEIEVTEETVVPYGQGSVSNSWFLSAMLVLRGFTKQLGVACSRYSWNEITGNAPGTIRKLPPFQGKVLDFHMFYLANRSPRTDSITREDITWFTENFERAQKLFSKNHAFSIALIAAVEWRYTKDARTAIARLWIGIEALLGVDSELVFRLALYGSSLLEDRGELRLKRFQQIKKLYSIRSKTVHGGEVSSQDLQNAIYDSFDLLRDLLILFIQNGEAFQQQDFENKVFL